MMPDRIVNQKQPSSEKFVIQFPSGEFLFTYMEQGGVRPTLVLEFAKLFHSESVARSAADIFGGTVRRVTECGGEWKLALDRRMPLRLVPEANPEALELVVKACVELSGSAVYTGLQLDGAREPLAVFVSKRTRKSFAVSLIGLTSDKVRGLVFESDQRFQKLGAS